MSEPKTAVEAAAKAIWDDSARFRGPQPWEIQTEAQKDVFRGYAIAAITAAGAE